MQRACLPPRSPLSSSPSAPLSPPPSAVRRPSPHPVQTLSEETFLKPLTPTGEQGSLVSLPETLHSGGRVLALGRATKNEVYPKEGNGCLWDISFTIKGLLSSTHTPWAWDACRRGDQTRLEPWLPLSTLQPLNHDQGRQATKHSLTLHVGYKATYCHPAYSTSMQNTSWEMPGWMTQMGITTVGRNINLRYVDDTTLKAESEEELKSLSMKEKEESEKAGLKTQHSKN